MSLLGSKRFDKSINRLWYARCLRRAVSSQLRLYRTVGEMLSAAIKPGSESIPVEGASAIYSAHPSNTCQHNPLFLTIRDRPRIEAAPVRGRCRSSFAWDSKLKVALLFESLRLVGRGLVEGCAKASSGEEG